MNKLRTLVVGLGRMGMCHALSYHANPGFEIVGLVNRSPVTLPDALATYPVFSSFEEAMALKPDLVAINTFTDTHAPYAIAAMEAGSHVFVEKPIALTVEDAEMVVATALRTKRKLVVGHILRHHPGWTEFVEKAREVGPPYVMRMNLNQQSSGSAWESHKKLLRSTSPIVDCGVHYIDIMLQITGSEPIGVRGMGLRLSQEINQDEVNYGHLQVIFEDGSIGWFESGWGPMISETAFFVQDVMGPRGSVSIAMNEHADVGLTDNHTRTDGIRIHDARVDSTGGFVRRDVLVPMSDDGGLQALCNRQQQFVLEAIQSDFDLREHMDNAVTSLSIVLAADASIADGDAIGFRSRR